MSKIAQDERLSAVVRIVTDSIEGDWEQPWRHPIVSQSTGSGFFINNQGYFITCAHCVLNSVRVVVNLPSLSGHYEHPCRVLGMCPESDVALCKVDMDALQHYILSLVEHTDASHPIHTFYDADNGHASTPFLELCDAGESYNLEPGMQLTAIGYPLGSSTTKITAGTFSGYEDGNIHTTAPINPGNSGGPLLAPNGKVVGINSSTAVGNDISNVHFAVPIDEYRLLAQCDAVADCVENPSWQATSGGVLVHKPRFGAIFENTTNGDHLECVSSSLVEKNAQQTQTSNPCQGLRIGVLSDNIQLINGTPYTNPLRRAGMMEGDILTNVNQHQLDNFGDAIHSVTGERVSFRDLERRTRWNSTVAIRFWSQRNSEFRACPSLEMNYRNPSNVQTWYIAQEGIPDFETVGGLCVMPLCFNHYTEDVAFQADLEILQNPRLRMKSHLVVTWVVPGTEASKGRVIRAGNIIVEVNGTPVSTMDEYRKAILLSLDAQKPKSTWKISWKTRRDAKFVHAVKDIIERDLGIFERLQVPLTEALRVCIQQSR